MRIAVVGAGGVGGGFGAALAKAGADVTFIARGAHLAAMKSAGLKIESPRGDTHLVPTQATDGRPGRLVRLRCVTTPDAAQKVLLQRLGVALPTRLRRLDEPALL